MIKLNPILHKHFFHLFSRYNIRHRLIDAALIEFFFDNPWLFWNGNFRQTWLVVQLGQKDLSWIVEGICCIGKNYFISRRCEFDDKKNSNGTLFWCFIITMKCWKKLLFTKGNDYQDISFWRNILIITS